MPFVLVFNTLRYNTEGSSGKSVSRCVSPCEQSSHTVFDFHERSLAWKFPPPEPVVRHKFHQLTVVASDAHRQTNRIKATTKYKYSTMQQVAADCADRGRMSAVALLVFSSTVWSLLLGDDTGVAAADEGAEADSVGRAAADDTVLLEAVNTL